MPDDLSLGAPVPGDTPTPDELAEAERIARHHLRYQASVPLDMFVAEYDRRGAEIEQRRAELCKALAIPHDTPWEAALESARSAGVVRDAEYRTRDRVDEENARLRTRLAALATAGHDALAILDGRASGDANDRYGGQPRSALIELRPVPADPDGETPDA